ncbi:MULTISPECIES: hypothetical protein [unclassified Rhizobium]|uniref:hypothetical protein n=1 Tax=unclassified Rhizobium TaxID=2613769 RepID=UPI0016204642|nr:MULTISPECIES: hypothetical protein [unclassified Rhizobium]MBB3543634.1 ribosomal protein S16 [Rhizobium sp. BK399]MCS3741874.1 ribosomal protein S16 [Rhizobium sp. BK661]
MLDASALQPPKQRAIKELVDNVSSGGVMMYDVERIRHWLSHGVTISKVIAELEASVDILKKHVPKGEK